MNLTTLSGLVFLTVLLLFLGIQQLKAGEQEIITSRIKKVFGERGKKKNKSDHKFQLMELSSRPFTARKITARVDAELAKADIPIKGEEFLGLLAISVIVAGLFFTLISGSVVAGILAAVLGWYLPRFGLRMAISRRINKFNSQIGDALVIMGNSMRSGFSFLQAMDMVRKELPNPIAKEFGVAIQEMNWGTSTEDALGNLAARINSEDLDLVITAVIIQRQVGGNLAEVLDNIANTIRERVRIKGEISTLTAQGKLSGLVVGLLPFFLVLTIFFMNPEYIKPLFTSKAGLTMVTLAMLSQLIGITLIRKIVQIPI